MVNFPFQSFFGIDLIVRPDPMMSAPAWPRRRRSKKIRLLKKWVRRFGYRQVVDEVEAARIYQINGKVYCTAAMKQNIMGILDAQPAPRL